MPKLIAVPFMIAKKWKQHKCPSTDEQVNKIWNARPREYYLVITRNEVLIHATAWTNLKKHYAS